METRKKKALQAEVYKHVEAGSALYTDARLFYSGLDLAAFFFVRLGRGGSALLGTATTALTALRNLSNASDPSRISGCARVESFI